MPLSPSPSQSWSRLAEDAVDDGGEAAPLRALLGQRSAARGGQRVGASLAATRRGPRALQVTGSLEPPKGGIDGAGGQVERATAAHREGLDDRVAVAGLPLEHGQDQRVEV